MGRRQGSREEKTRVNSVRDELDAACGLTAGRRSEHQPQRKLDLASLALKQMFLTPIDLDGNKPRLPRSAQQHGRDALVHRKQFNDAIPYLEKRSI